MAEPPSTHEAQGTRTSPAPRGVHPFAYSAQRTLPLSALGSVVNMEREMEEQIRATRPHSEVLSRGAGMRTRMDAGATDSRDSVGMGTFGLAASQDPMSSQEVRSVSELGSIWPDK
jgi:hypothetical protein